jgi:hypothetical protein
MGGTAKGQSQQATAGELANSTALTSIAQDANARSGQLFNTSFPGFQSAENFEQTLSSGDPYAIARAVAPADQQITAATTGARQNILNNSPAGGEKNLALEQTAVNQGAQTGAVASQGYLNSFNSLAQLAGSGIGLGNSATNSAISGLGTANSGFNNVYNQGTENQRQYYERNRGHCGYCGLVAGLGSR